MRPQTYEDATESALLKSLLRGNDQLENTVFALLDPDGEPAALRLWIVDLDGAAWVLMPRPKADAYALDTAPAELLRDGVVSCVEPRLLTDRAVVNAAVRARYEKYAVHRLATAISLFEESAGEHTVALRLDPCPPPAAVE